MSSPDAKIIYTGPSPRGWHRLQLAAECLQKFAWERRAPQREDGELSPPLAKGSLMHLALAQHYARMRAEDRKDEWVEPAKAVDLISQLEGTEEYVPGILETFERYVEHYCDDAQRWKILEVEELMETWFGGKYRLTGRLDLVVEDSAGQVWAVDHKTSSRVTKRHKQFYGISGQLLGYSRMAREKYGDRFAGLIVNLIQHGGEKFQRVTLERSPNLEARFERIVIDIEESIERMDAEGRHYADWPKAVNELTCFHRYGACRFLDSCRWGEGAKKAGSWSVGSF